MTCANSISLILRRLDEIERKLDRMLQMRFLLLLQFAPQRPAG